jgi:hypothetical protein
MRQRLQIAKFSLLLILPLALHPASFVAQKAAPHTPKSATKFDEYGQISADDHSAKLDNFAK